MSDPSELERLRQLSGAHFRLSNGYGVLTFSLQVGAVAFATLPAFRDAVPDWTPYLTAVLAILATLLRSVSETHKSTADEMLRRIEAADGAGVPLKPRELADWFAAASPLVCWLADGAISDGAYFASHEPPSARRTVMNTYESAWWSKHLAATQGAITWVGVVVTLGAAVLVLRIAASPQPVLPVGTSAVDAANAAILFLLTQAPLRKVLGLRAFQAASARVMERAERLLAQESVSDLEAADVRTQYQFARRGASAISTLVWKVRRRRLNALWARVALSTGHSDLQAVPEAIDRTNLTG